MLGALRTRWRRSVRFRLLASTLAVVAPVVIGSAYWEASTQQARLLRDLDKHGNDLVAATAVFCVEPLLMRDAPFLDTYVETLTRNRERVVFARVLDDKGKVLSPREPPQYDAALTREYSAPVIVRGDGVGASQSAVGTVQLGLSVASTYEAMNAVRARGFLVALLLFAILALGIAILHRRNLGRPLAELDRLAQRLGAGDYDSTIALDSVDELGRLAATLDDMRLRINESIQELWRNNLRLARSDRVKSDFLAMMSHEIRTPMNGVVGFARQLLETPLGPEQADMVRLVLTSAESLMTILNDILDFSKIEADQLRLEGVAFEIRPLLTEVASLARAISPAGTAVTVEVSVGDEVPVTVLGDPARLRQVLNNLVSNAVKFSAGSGRVAIRVGRASSGDGVRFSVRDEGIGIPANRLDALFVPFQQVDSSHARRFGGTGLGLAICQHLVKLMGGEITVASEEGVGSEFGFTIDLPATAPAQPDAAEVDAVAEVRPGLRVLVVEDNAVNLKLIQRLLQRLEAVVVTAGDGVDGVREFLAAPETFDVVLMDCQMPRMDGFEATARIRKSGETGARIPIIAVTANTMSGDREHCLAVGMNDFLPKPIRPNDLRTALAKWAPAVSTVGPVG